MLKNRSWIFFIFLILQVLQGCSLGRERMRPDERSADRFVETILLFGLCKNELCESKKDFVTDKEWISFVNNYIIPKFTDGLTVVDSTGQWRNKSGKLIKEKSKIVILLYPDSIKSEGLIEAIRENYKTLFHQESVLKIKHAKVDVSF
jgi:hypothetical protein